MAEALLMSIVGEEVVLGMTRRILEPWPVHISVHRDTICWMSSFVSPPKCCFNALCIQSAYCNVASNAWVLLRLDKW